jgi:hypothetical protein
MVAKKGTQVKVEMEGCPSKALASADLIGLS